ncbi:hypothetical protein [Duncaniella muris]|uniref:hypothetical protein n=1 Tax=Duncaniella muris TaxID=2094150 RepID=UPI0025B7601D|nr:hypothetical protein [Duncaniella muris]
MTQAINMPRVEIVGSFLPPEELENALNEKIRGNLSDADYHAVEDRVIDRLIDREIEAGLQIVTDGEMRRKSWDRDFWEGFEGMSRERIDTGNIYQDDILRHDLLRFSGKIEFNPAHPFFDKFVHMQELTAGRAEVRQTIPSPGQLYMRMFLSSNGDPGKFYATPDTLIDDIVEAYSRTIAEFYRLGCRHIQLDTEVWGRLSSPEFDRMLLLGGADVNEITRLLLDLINRSIATRPADLEITFNIAANEQAVPRWYDEKELANLRLMLETIDADAFLLPFEISSPEAINALRWLPAEKRVILGLVDGSLPNLESVNDIVTAVRMARRYVPMEKLSISPTCGFKVRDRERQGLNYETQWTKIALLRQAAELAAE